LDPTAKSGYDNLQKEFQAAQKSYNDYAGYIEDQWQRYISQHPEIPTDQYEAERRIFERDRGFSAELQRRRKLIRAASVKLNAFIRKNTPKELWTIIDAKTYYEDENFQIRLPSSPIFDSPTKKDLWTFFHAQSPVIELDEFLQFCAPRL
jgi:hypothetical protein